MTDVCPQETKKGGRFRTGNVLGYKKSGIDYEEYE